MSERTGVSNSVHFDQFKKFNENISDKNKANNNSSVLLHSGRHSMSELKSSKDIERNPYFPHRYEDSNENKVKWTGKRDWDYDKP